MTDTDQTALESKSLPVHVTLCTERYRNIDGRLKALGRHIWRIEIWIVATLTTAIASLAAKVMGVW